MTGEAMPDFEGLLRQAFRPVEPPADLATRMEETLASLHSMAAEELEAWELSSMRDPRNWAKPVASAAVAGVAGAGLVALRVRGQHKKRKASSANTREVVEKTLQAVADEARKLLDN